MFRSFAKKSDAVWTRLEWQLATRMLEKDPTFREYAVQLWNGDLFQTNGFFNREQCGSRENQ
jgi:hypothetical protein